jgi:hypothetical protein
MSTLPDFSSYGYRLKRELGCNLSGGRVTYQAVHLETLQPVVIKQFQFAQSSSNWADYDAYQREIRILRSFEHPGIPQYLDSFQTADGFCMVQQYIDAPSLATERTFSLDDIRTIAIKALEILTYLQNRVPAVIHRDIKPDNILVSDAIDVYLVDFGFARIGHGEVGVSSVVKGTLGFMPPEQLFNRQLTPASDLYGLGITLICLLTNTKSIDVGNLIDITYRINFRTLLPNLSSQWLNWLEKMVEPRLNDRFPNAAIALSSLPRDVVFAPHVCLSTSAIHAGPVRCGAILTYQIRVQNSVPQTKLRGEWSVAPHPGDPPSAAQHVWIAVTPRDFEANLVNCEVWIDTSRLMPGQTYVRELCLHTNAAHSIYQVTLQVQTQAEVERDKPLPYGRLGVLCGGAIAGTWILGLAAQVIAALAGLVFTSVMGVAAGVVVGLEMAAAFLAITGARHGASAGVWGGCAAGAVVLAMLVVNPVSQIGPSGWLGVGFGVLYGVLAGLSAGLIAEQLSEKGLAHPTAIALALSVIAWGSSLGLGLILGFISPVASLLIGLTGLPLLAIALYYPFRRYNRRVQAQRLNRRLIKP